MWIQKLFICSKYFQAQNSFSLHSEVPKHEVIFASSPTCTDTQYKAAQDKISGPVVSQLK